MFFSILELIDVTLSHLIFISKLEEETWLFSNPSWFLKFYYIIEVAIELNTSDRTKISFQQKRLQIAKKKSNALANSVSRAQLVIS